MNSNILAIGLILTTGFIAAQTAPVDTGKASVHAHMQSKFDARFNTADSNQDGKLSLDELHNMAQKRLAESFSKLDANQDGGISLEEMRQAHAQHKAHEKMPIGERMQSLDKNQDQALSREEMADKMPKLLEKFDQVDANHDDKLTADEITRFKTSRHADQAPPEQE